MDRKLRVVIGDAGSGSVGKLKDLVSTLGHEVVAHATSGPQLNTYCRVWRPDLVLAEFDMLGLVAASEWDRAEDGRSFAVIAVCDRVDDTTSPGVDACVARPVTPPIIARTIESVLERRSPTRPRMDSMCEPCHWFG